MLRKVVCFQALALALVAGGCSGTKDAGPAAPPTDAPPPPVVITKLQVEDATPPAFRWVDSPAGALEALVRARLQAAGYVFGAGADDAVRITLEARLARGLTDGEGFLDPKAERPATARTRAVWVVEGKLRVPGSPGSQYLFLEGADEAPAEADVAAALTRHAEKALDPVVQGLRARTAVLGLAPASLIQKIEDPDPVVRLAVVDQLGLRREASAVGALAKRANVEQDREVLLRLIGALAEIGDDRAAEALIGLANPRDREVLRAVLDALSVVGGERVSDFLDILASHDAPDVRELVEDARTRLARKARPDESPPP